jgi:hypothetical protein
MSQILAESGVEDSILATAVEEAEMNLKRGTGKVKAHMQVSVNSLGAYAGNGATKDWCASNC